MGQVDTCAGRSEVEGAWELGLSFQVWRVGGAPTSMTGSLGPHPGWKPASCGFEPTLCPLYQLLKTGETSVCPLCLILPPTDGSKQADGPVCRSVQLLPLDSCPGWGFRPLGTAGPDLADFEGGSSYIGLHSWQFAVSRNVLQATGQQGGTGGGRGCGPILQPPQAVKDGARLGRRARSPDQPVLLKLSLQD